MLIKKLPFFTLLLSLALISSFFVSHQHDERLWAQIETHYQDHLLEVEVPIYFDYLSRQFKVEGLGSQAHIDALILARQNDKILPIIQTILEDAEFVPYLNANGKLFLSEETISRWQDERQIIAPIYQATSAQRLGVSESDFRISQVLTHVLGHPYKLSFALLFISLVIICFKFERALGAFKLYVYVLISAFTSSMAYLLLSSEGAPVLQGPLALVYGLAAALLTYQTQKTNWDIKSALHSKLTLLWVGVFALSLLAYTSLTTLSSTNPLVYLVSSSVVPLMAGAFFMITSLRISAKETTQDQTKPDHDSSTHWEYRAELSKALDFLSRFEFNSARQLLNALAKQYPDSRAILEQRYHLAKLHPEDSLYWKLAKNLIELCVQKEDHKRISRLFKDIQKSAASKKRAQEQLEPEHYHKIMTVFVNHADLSKAEHAFHFLELAGDQHIIQDACLVLINEFKIRGTTSKQQQYEMLLERLKA